MTRPYRTLFLTSASVAGALLIAAVIFPLVLRPTGGRRRHPSPQVTAFHQRQRALLRRARAALDAREYAKAESAYRRLVANRPEDHSLSIHLARLYDLQGRDRDALEAYTQVVEPYPSGCSSYQDDPTVLARYGDLLLRFGRRDQARAAYLRAVPPPAPTYLYDADHPQGRPIADPTRLVATAGSSDGELRAAAHIAAADQDASSGMDQEAARELSIALAADPSQWGAHARLAEMRARRGDRRGAKAEMGKAELLAPPTLKYGLQARRSRMGLTDTVTVMTINKDATSTVTQEPARE